MRSFTENDVALFTAGHNSAFADTWWFTPYTEEQTTHRAKMANTSYDGIRLLFQGEQLAGYCWTLLMSDGQRQQGVIGSIGLVPEFQGQGISKTILAAGLVYLRSAGADYIRLEVDGDNEPAIRLYHSHGIPKRPANSTGTNVCLKPKVCPKCKGNAYRPLNPCTVHPQPPAVADVLHGPVPCRHKYALGSD